MICFLILDEQFADMAYMINQNPLGCSANSFDHKDNQKNDGFKSDADMIGGVNQRTDVFLVHLKVKHHNHQN